MYNISPIQDIQKHLNGIKILPSGLAKVILVTRSLFKFQSNPRIFENSEYFCNFFFRFSNERTHEEGFYHRILPLFFHKVHSTLAIWAHIFVFLKTL